MATFLPSKMTVVVYPSGLSSDRPRFGSGVGTKGAGGPGILQTLGTLAGALSWLPSVTGVLGGLTPTLILIAVPRVAALGGAVGPHCVHRPPSRPRAADAPHGRIRAGPTRWPGRQTRDRTPPPCRPSNRRASGCRGHSQTPAECARWRR